MAVRGDRAEEQNEQAPTKWAEALGSVWQSSWGLRLSLGLVAVLVWAGVASMPSSPSPASSTSVPPAASTRVVAPTTSARPASTTDQATPAPSLPQQPLDITYDYGPGPQPVPDQSAAQLP